MPASATADRGLLIFDGDCGFCTTSVNWLEKNLPAMPPHQPYQWTELDDYGLTTEDAQERVWFVDDSHQYGGHLAIAAFLRKQPVAWMRALGWLGTIPPWSWAAGVAYKLVAKYRYKLPGGTPACQVRH